MIVLWTYVATPQCVYKSFIKGKKRCNFEHFQFKKMEKMQFKSGREGILAKYVTT